MQKPFRLHFGVGSSSTVDDISVKWPGSSSYTSYGNCSTGQIVQLRENQSSTTSVASKSENQISSMVIPNPFHSSAELRFKTLSEEHLKIRITNVLGALVFDNSQLWLKGIHSLQIPEQLEDGIYFYSIESPSGQQQQGRFVKVKH